MPEPPAEVSPEAMAWAEAILETVGPAGVITSVQPLLRRSGDFPVHICGATLQPFASTQLDPRQNSLLASGAGLSPQQALLATLGEALERYTLAQENPGIFSESAPASLSSELLSRWPLLFSPAAQSWEALSKALESTPAWLVARRCTRDNKQATDTLLMPSALVFADHATPILPACSNGMAAGPSFAFAALRAVYELIERDALLLSWYRRYAGKRVAPVSILSETIVDWINRLYGSGLEFRLYDISTDLGIFVFLGCMVVRKNGRSYSLACGAGCSLNPRKAAQRAFLEAALCRRGADDLAHTRGLLEDKVVAEYQPKILADHLYLYQHPASIHAANFLLNCPITARCYPQGEWKIASDAELGRILKQLEEHAYQAYFIDMTPQELRSLNVHVVRAVIPGLIPFFWGEYQPLPLARWQAPKHISGALLDRPINPAPHPFP